MLLLRCTGLEAYAVHVHETDHRALAATIKVATAMTDFLILVSTTY
jgi:hypothetical protein